MFYKKVNKKIIFLIFLIVVFREEAYPGILLHILTSLKIMFYRENRLFSKYNLWASARKHLTSSSLFTGSC